MGEITRGERKKALTALSSNLADLQQAIAQGDYDGTVESLGVVRALRDILEASEDLVALAAIDRTSMRSIAAEIGLSESAIPLLLARTQRLEEYADRNGAQARVTKRGLDAAEYDFLGQKGFDPDV